MTENTYNLTQEMLNFIVHKDNDKLNILRRAEKKLGTITLFILTRDLLEWNNPLFITANNFDKKKMSLLDDERDKVYKDNMTILLSTTPLLNEIFTIRGNYLLFKDTFDQQEITELREFIQNNELIRIQSKETRQSR